jgi:ribosomal protein L40E
LPLSGRILVIGDGDFSFSRALCNRIAQLGSDAHVTATSLDSRQTLLEKYSTAALIMEELAKYQFVEVLHGVDATSLLCTLSIKTPFDLVVWNFPYPVASERCQASEGAVLLNRFLSSVSEDAVLTKCGKVYITLASQQGGTTREAKRFKHSWRIEDVAVKNGFDLFEVIPFDATEYVGYTPRRAFLDESFPHDDARMHILQRSNAQRKLTTATDNTWYDMLSSKERHIAGRLASTIHSAPFRSSALTPQTGRRVVRNCLVSFAEKSETARSLLVAERAFDEVYRLLSNYTSLSHQDSATAWRVVALLDKAYSVRDGELLASWPSAAALQSAMNCAISICGHCFAEVYQDAELAKKCFEGQLSLETLLLAVNKPRAEEAAANLTQVQGDRLCSSMYVLSCLLMHCELEEQVSHVDESSMSISPPGPEAANTARAPACMDLCLFLLARVVSMKIANARIYRRIGCIHAFRVNLLCSERGDSDSERKLQTEPALKETLTILLATCELLLHADPNDLQALHLKAFALRSFTPSWTGGALSPQCAERLGQAIALHERYLSLAQPDDRFRPDAHYSVGALKLAARLGSAEPSARERVILSALGDYSRGLEAEGSQLPCLPPRGPVDAKELLATVRAAYPGPG